MSYSIKMYKNNIHSFSHRVPMWCHHDNDEIICHRWLLTYIHIHTIHIYIFICLFIYFMVNLHVCTIIILIIRKTRQVFTILLDNYLVFYKWQELLLLSQNHYNRSSENIVMIPKKKKNSLLCYFNYLLFFSVKLKLTLPINY